MERFGPFFFSHLGEIGHIELMLPQWITMAEQVYMFVELIARIPKNHALQKREH